MPRGRRRHRHPNPLVRAILPIPNEDILDEYESEDEYSDTTVLSEDSYEMWSDSSSSSSSSSSSLSWNEAWARFQRRCLRRDQKLYQLSQSKQNPAFMKVLRQREDVIRRQEYERLFLLHEELPLESYDDDDNEARQEELNHQDATKQTDKAPELITEAALKGGKIAAKKARQEGKKDDDMVPKEVIFQRMQEDTRHTSESTKSVAVEKDGEEGLEEFMDAVSELRPEDLMDLEATCATRTWKDLWILEMGTTIPAVGSLLVHNLFHSALYNAIEVISELCKDYFERHEIGWEFSGIWSWFSMDDTFWAYALLMTTGLLLLRSSGLLFWWLNKTDFDCLKWDYHNRNRSQSWDARSLVWMKRQSTLRALLYFAGYQLCYTVINDIFLDQMQLFDQTAYFVSHLPSRQSRTLEHLWDEYSATMNGTELSKSNCLEKYSVGEDETLWWNHSVMESDGYRTSLEPNRVYDARDTGEEDEEEEEDDDDSVEEEEGGVEEEEEEDDTNEQMDKEEIHDDEEENEDDDDGDKDDEDDIPSSQYSMKTKRRLSDLMKTHQRPPPMLTALCQMEGPMGLYREACRDVIEAYADEDDVIEHSRRRKNPGRPSENPDPWARMVMMDIQYLWRNVEFVSFTRYMHDFADPLHFKEGESNPLLTPQRALAVSTVAMVVSTVYLKRYGFRVFDKY